MEKLKAFRLVRLALIVGSIIGAPLARADVGFDVRIGAPVATDDEYAPVYEPTIWVPGYWGWQDGERVWEEGHWEPEQRDYYIAARHHDHREHWHHEHHHGHEDNDDEDDDD